MFRSSTRVAALAAMPAVSSLGSIAIASGVASATAPKATCTSGTLTITGGGTITGCTPPAATGGSGKIVASISKQTGVITWNKTGTTRVQVHGEERHEHEVHQGGHGDQRDRDRHRRHGCWSQDDRQGSSVDDFGLCRR